MTDNLAVEQAANLPRRGRASSGERDNRLLVCHPSPSQYSPTPSPPSLPSITRTNKRRDKQQTPAQP